MLKPEISVGCEGIRIVQNMLQNQVLAFLHSELKQCFIGIICYVPRLDLQNMLAGSYCRKLVMQRSLFEIVEVGLIKAIQNKCFFWILIEDSDKIVPYS